MKQIKSIGDKRVGELRSTQEKRGLEKKTNEKAKYIFNVSYQFNYNEHAACLNEFAIDV